MKRNYQGVIERIKTVALAHLQIKSADVGRELEFDTTKNNTWPRFFARTENSPIAGGLGSVELSVNMTFLVMDRLKSDRSNVQDVLNQNHSILTDILAVLNKEQIVRVSDNFQLEPLYDYQDSQTAGWQVGVRVYLDSGFECYPVDVEDTGTTWFVRPAGSTYGAGDGTSYADAWAGFPAIVWDSPGVVPGDTIYVCGNHSTGWTFPRSGTAGKPITVRGDYSVEAGLIDVAGLLNSCIVAINKDYLTFTGLTLQNANVSNLAFTDCENIITNDLILLNSGNQGVQHEGATTAVHNNITSIGNVDDGISVHDDGVIIVNTAYIANNDQGINMVGNAQLTADNVTFVNNVSIDAWPTNANSPGSCWLTLKNSKLQTDIEANNDANITLENCQLQGFTVSGTTRGVAELTNCTLAGALTVGANGTANLSGCYVGSYTASASSSIVIFDRCFVNDNDAHLGQLTAIHSLFDGSTATDHIIDAESGSVVDVSYCIFTNIPAGKFAFAARTGAVSPRFDNNTIIGSSNVGRGLFSQIDITANNNIYLSLDIGVFRSGTPTIVLNNSCFYDNTTDINGTVTNNSPVNADPEIVDVSNRIYSLSPGSPCFGAGLDLGSGKNQGISKASWGSVDNHPVVTLTTQPTNWTIGAML